MSHQLNTGIFMGNESPATGSLIETRITEPLNYQWARVCGKGSRKVTTDLDSDSQLTSINNL